MKILVLGATGMLGHRLYWGLSEKGYRVIGGVREKKIETEPFCNWPVFIDKSTIATGLDGYNLPQLRQRLKSIRPDVIVNCIGVIKQRDEGQSSVSCIALNALLPHVLEEIVAGWDGLLINFSTDCVFKGDRGCYTEDDAGDAEDWYGRTKYMGEVQGPHALTLRTSIIGRELRGHRSLVDWFLSQAGGTVRGFAKAIYSGITTREMVNVIDLILSRNDKIRGLFQVASTSISKYELLCLIREKTGMHIAIQRDEETGIVDRSLNSDRFYRATGYKAPPWPEMISGLADDINRYTPKICHI
jgi:dTDP-4-dehydrorhamnose reductase